MGKVLFGPYENNKVLLRSNKNTLKIVFVRNYFFVSKSQDEILRRIKKSQKLQLQSIATLKRQMKHNTTEVQHLLQKPES